jgi:hypothetical protein
MERRRSASAIFLAKRCEQPPGQQLGNLGEIGAGTHSLLAAALSSCAWKHASLCLFPDPFPMSPPFSQAQHEILRLKQQLGAQSAELKRILAGHDIEKISWQETTKVERLSWEKTRDDERRSWEYEREKNYTKHQQLQVCFSVCLWQCFSVCLCQ